MILEADRSQVVSIDIQERLLPAMSEMRMVIERADLVAMAARQMNIPITASEQYPRGLGATYPKVRQSLGNEAIILEKMHFSCMRDPTIAERISGLRDAGRTQTVIFGIETHVCVAQTAIELRAQGYDVAVVADASSSRRSGDKQIALDRFRSHGIEVVTAEMVVFEWLEMAGTDNFRAMAPLIK